MKSKKTFETIMTMIIVILLSLFFSLDAKATGIENSKVDSVSLDLCGRIGINFYLDLPGNAKTVLINDYAYAIPAAESDGTYRFSYTVSAKDISTKAIIKVLDTNGQAIEFDSGESAISYSVDDYINTVLGKPDSFSIDTVELCNRLKMYGYSAMAYFNLAVDAPEIEDVAINNYDPYVNLPQTIKYNGSSLILKDTVSIRHYISGDVDSITAIKVKGTDISLHQVGDIYYMEIANIPVMDWDEIYSAKIYTTDGEYGIDYCVMSYCQMAKQSVNKRLKNVANAMYNLLGAAKKYNKWNTNIVITKQPESVNVSCGEQATVSIEAENADRYEWMAFDIYEKVWKIVSKGSSYSAVCTYENNMKVKCVVYANNRAVESDIVHMVWGEEPDEETLREENRELLKDISFNTVTGTVTSETATSKNCYWIMIQKPDGEWVADSEIANSNVITFDIAKDVDVSGTYKVIVYGGNTYYGYFSEDDWMSFDINKEAINKVDSINVNDDVISWEPVEGAKGYYIYMMDMNKDSYSDMIYTNNNHLDLNEFTSEDNGYKYDADSKLIIRIKTVSNNLSNYISSGYGVPLLVGCEDLGDYCNLILTKNYSTGNEEDENEIVPACSAKVDVCIDYEILENCVEKYWLDEEADKYLDIDQDGEISWTAQGEANAVVTVYAEIYGRVYSLELRVSDKKVYKYHSGTRTFLNHYLGEEFDYIVLDSAFAKDKTPEKEGFIFEGWYTDPGFNTEYDADLEDTYPCGMDLYAKFRECDYEVRFVAKEPVFYDTTNRVYTNELVYKVAEGSELGYVVVQLRANVCTRYSFDFNDGVYEEILDNWFDSDATTSISLDKEVHSDMTVNVGYDIGFEQYISFNEVGVMIDGQYTYNTRRFFTQSSDATYGDLLEEFNSITDPYDEYNKLIGWYRDANLTIPVNRSEIISKDGKCIYACWSKDRLVTPTLTFEDDVLTMSADGYDDSDAYYIVWIEGINSYGYEYKQYLYESEACRGTVSVQVPIEMLEAGAYTINASAYYKYQGFYTNTSENITKLDIMVDEYMPPKITKQPVSDRTVVGRGIDFTLEISGSATSYEWEKLVDNQWVSDTTTTEPKFIASSDEEATVTYRCVVHNGSKQTISDSFVATWESADKFIQINDDGSVTYHLPGNRSFVAVYYNPNGLPIHQESIYNRSVTDLSGKGLRFYQYIDRAGIYKAEIWISEEYYSYSHAEPFVELTFEIPETVVKYDTPSNFRWEGNKLYWDEVENASQYTIVFDSNYAIPYIVYENCIDFDQAVANGTIQAGMLTPNTAIRVRAESNNYKKYLNSDYATAPNWGEYSGWDD